jgi:hypothetical protein
MKDIEIRLWDNSIPDRLNNLTVNLPFIPIVGDHINFMYPKKPDWVNATPEQWETFKGDGYLVTRRLISNDHVELEVTVWD